MARPSFLIDAERLKLLREERHLTQRQLSSSAYKFLKKAASDEVATKHYQKIERTGRTSKSMAAAIAEVLGTSVAVLQGEAPDELEPWLKSLECQLREQSDAGGNASLAKELQDRAGSESPFRDLAHDITAALEAAQIGQDAEEMARLAELTGWSQEYLARTVSLDGYWLLLSSGLGANSTEIMRGTSEVMRRIESEADGFAKLQHDEVAISLREKAPWLHVDMRRARLADFPRSFRFVRCLPTVKGLQWAKPTNRDRFWLIEPLEQLAYECADFVESFDGQTRPGDVRRLRLQLCEIDASGAQRSVAVFRGDLDELPDEILGRFRAESASHRLALNRIVAGLWSELAPYLSEWPYECWHAIGGTHVRLELQVPLKCAREAGRTPEFGVKYVLRLVEETGSGDYARVPWRRSSVEIVAQHLQRLLSEHAGSRTSDPAPRLALPG